MSQDASRNVDEKLRMRNSKVRQFAAYSLILIFGITVIASLGIVIFNSSVLAAVKDLLQAILPAETALLGSVIGFYFGSEKASSYTPQQSGGSTDFD